MDIKFETVSMYEQKEGELVLVDLETVPVHQRVDFHTRNQNILGGFVLCDECDGTGNEFFSMYHECPKCGGSGRSG